MVSNSVDLLSPVLKEGLLYSSLSYNGVQPLGILNFSYTYTFLCAPRIIFLFLSPEMHIKTGSGGIILSSLRCKILRRDPYGKNIPKEELHGDF